MTFRPIDDDDTGSDEYFKKHFVYRNRTKREMDDLLVNMYMELSPKFVDMINKYIIENKEYMPFFMLERFLGLFMLKTLHNNAQAYPEPERKPLMEQSIQDIKLFLDNYINTTDFSGPRSDPKYFSNPEDDK